MTEPGYVYALINYAMPGLVKVGMTTRSPAGRIDELSGATGVPTPFELVYDVLVPDVAGAEAFVHAQLSAAGYRVSENREFFRAPIREVVRLMIHLRESMESADFVTSRRSTVAVPSLGDGERDALLREAAEVVVQNQQGSTSLLQRRLNVAYGRAARLIDELHSAGVLGPPDGPKPRDVLVGLDELDRICGPRRR